MVEPRAGLVVKGDIAVEEDVNGLLRHVQDAADIIRVYIVYNNIIQRVIKGF